MDAYLPIISEVCCGLIQRGYVIHDLPTMPFPPDETVAILATKRGVKHLIFVMVTDEPPLPPVSPQQSLAFRDFCRQSQAAETFFLFVERLTSTVDWHAAGLEM